MIQDDPHVAYRIRSGKIVNQRRGCSVAEVGNVTGDFTLSSTVSLRELAVPPHAGVVDPLDRRTGALILAFSLSPSSIHQYAHSESGSWKT